MSATRHLGRATVARRRAAGLLAAVLVTTVCAAGCTTTGLAFRRDDRLQLHDFPDRSHITVPHRIHWTFAGTLASQSTGAPGVAAAFGVLIDWTPPPPGRSLESLLSSDPACRGPLGCPDGYLAQNRIYVTTATTFDIVDVPTGSVRTEQRTFHELTIVLVDAEGRRVGETSAWTRFRIPGVGV